MKILGPLIFGLAGAAILVALGAWQMQRLTWKEGKLAEIDARIGDAPGALPAKLDPKADKYRPVTLRGAIQAQMIRVLVSQKRQGAGYRIISAMVLEDGRRVLIDRGIMPVTTEARMDFSEPVTVTGNLHWPDEIDSFTPEPDLDKNIWFARDVPAMARALGTENALIVLRDATFDDAPIIPAPVDSAGVPNNHLQYAITWFSLAAIWLAMTGYFLRRRGADARRT